MEGVAQTRYARTQEPVGEEVEQASRSTSKSAGSRAFFARTSERLGELMARRLDDIRLTVLMLDGIDMKAAATSSRSKSPPTA
jgi:putative transposase